MPCPKCHSHDLWDDQFAWGCNACGWMTMGGVQNYISPRDQFRVPPPPSPQTSVPPTKRPSP